MSDTARHKGGDHFATSSTIVTVVCISAVVVVAILMAYSASKNNDEPTPRALLSSPSPFPFTTTSAFTPTPSPSTTAGDLVAAAKRIKPLEDIKKGDRVIYQGHVCTWQLWDQNINTSTIKCPGTKAFQIETGRLTPVELATGPSTLKVRHR